jgi:diadenosine tetraphosphate (Ap4A) HIT family hydrolase
MVQRATLVSSSDFCRFCRFFSDKKKRTGIDAPWLSNDYYAAMVSIGALVPGWSLVCPIEHQINLSDHYGNAEFWDFVTKVVDALHFRYGDVRLFEHGAYAQDSATGCGTWHAHLHVVPLHFSLMQETLHYDSEKKWYPCSASNIQNFSNGQEYLFVADKFDKDQTTGLITLLEEGTSQFFRKVIANRLGLYESFDYKLFPMLDIAEQSTIELQSDFLDIQAKVGNL